MTPATTDGGGGVSGTDTRAAPCGGRGPGGSTSRSPGERQIYWVSTSTLVLIYVIIYAPAALEGESHMEPGGPMGPRSVLFLRKYFSILARMCFPYVYFRSVEMCGRILCIRILRWLVSATSIIFWTT